MLHNKAFRDKLFLLLAFGALCAAIYHAIGIFFPVNEAPPRRHAVFVGINVLLAACLIKRPVFFLPLFALLMLQQMYGHGKFLIDTWNQSHSIDWPSVFVLIFFPIALWALWLDYKDKRT